MCSVLHALFSILYHLLIFPVVLNQVSCVTKDADHFPMDGRPHVGGREGGFCFIQFLDGDSENQFVFLFLYWLFLLLFSDNPVGCLFLFLVFYLTDAFNFNVPRYFTCFICACPKDLRMPCIIFSRNMTTLTVVNR